MTNSAEAASAVESSRPLGFSGAVAQLLLRPEEFMATRGANLTAVQIFLLIWVIGMSAAIDRIETRQAASIFYGTGPTEAGTSWAFFWGMIIGGAVIAGPVRWYVGGFFCSIRLSWCGAKGVPGTTARRISACTDLISAVPTIISQLVISARHSSHASAWASSIDPLGFTLLAMTFWSFWAIYRVALDIEGARAGAVLGWFLIVPSAASAMLLGGVMIGGLLSG